MIKENYIEINGRKIVSGYPVYIIAELSANHHQQLGVDRYISPPGSKTYIEANNLFAAHDIELCYHDYQHPTYRQLFGSFVSHLSVLDLLFNQGEQSMPIIRSGRVSQ